LTARHRRPNQKIGEENTEVEARATLNGPSVSKTFVAAVLVLVAIGLGAMGGYAARGIGASGASTTVAAPVHAAPGTVLRQDNPQRAVLPNRIQKDDALTVKTAPHGAPRDGAGFLP
jgi:hypothetical protein